MLLTGSDVVSTLPQPGFLHPWYAIRTKSNQERIAAVSLANKGYDSYLPYYAGLDGRVDRTVVIERPLFPGYLFCRFDAKFRMPIITTPGIVCILGFGSGPLPVAESEIEAIRTVLSSGLAAQPRAFLREGQWIRVTGGCMKGVEGILLEEKSHWRLVISVTILQRSVSVEIDRHLVSFA
jgi:transcriptional antiterminator NusG